MIPRQVAEELGQPLPLFIKWDDADYGLRAAEHGYPTVTMPGAAIWHMAWSDKDDAIDWQAYFHLRNRLVVAAMHWDGDIDGPDCQSPKATLKHLLCLEYSTVAIQNKAIDDFLAGPEHIFSILESALPEVHAMRKEYPDAVVLPGRHPLPPPSGWREGAQADRLRCPPSVFGWPAVWCTSCARKTPRTTRRPQLNVATQDARWFLLCKVDGVTVTTADGRGVVYRQRDRAKMFELLRESVRRQVRLARKFNRCAGYTGRRCRCSPASRSGRRFCWNRIRPRAMPESGQRRHAARRPHWWPCSPRWPIGRACWRRTRLVAFRRALARLAGRRGAGRAAAARAAGGSGSRPGRAHSRPRRRGADQAGGAAATRPDHPAIAVNVGTPSRLSFPSAHATSTTAAAMLLGRVTGLPLPAVLVPPMALSRLVLGVHYPSDVATGVSVGARSRRRTEVDRRRGIGASSDERGSAPPVGRARRRTWSPGSSRRSGPGSG